MYLIGRKITLFVTVFEKNMRIVPILFFLLTFSSISGQYLFKGQAPMKFAQKPIYLSLIEDYRKTSRVYINQIIATATVDASGRFSFSGNALPFKNHIYRIHLDGCDEGQLAKNHFLKECTFTESLLFIANNRDTINFPLLSDQAFCEIHSTNAAASFLFEAAVLQEKMILDFSENETALARNLKFRKWFDTLHDFAENSGEPLVKLFIYSFLSNRTNETYEPYSKYLREHAILPSLADELNNGYGETTYASLFYDEVGADLKRTNDGHGQKWYRTDSKYLFPIALILLTAICFYSIFKRKIRQSGYNSLSPQEKKICDAILKGKTNNEIASDFFISLSTVKTHVNNIYKKLGVSSRDELKGKF